MAVLPVQKPDLSATGSSLSFTSATSAGDSFPNTGIEFVHVVNSSPSAKTVTFDSPGTCSFGLAANSAHDVAGIVGSAGAAPANRKIFGPFPAGRFNDGNSRVQITYDDPSGVTIAVQSPASA